MKNTICSAVALMCGLAAASANAQTAVLRNQVIGTQQLDIKRAPTRLFDMAGLVGSSPARLS